MPHINEAGRLWQAAEGGDLAKLKGAICPGRDINQLWDQWIWPGQNALHAVAERGHSYMVGFLLALGADPEAMSRPGSLTSFNTLHLAASGGHYEMARVLLDAGADASAMLTDWDWSGPATLLVLGDY